VKSHFAGRDFGDGENQDEYIFVKSHFADEEKLRGKTPSLTKRDFGKWRETSKFFKILI
jgi:hypothetical protein